MVSCPGVGLSKKGGGNKISRWCVGQNREVALWLVMAKGKTQELPIPDRMAPDSLPVGKKN